MSHVGPRAPATWLARFQAVQVIARASVTDFLRRLIAAVPYKLHTVLTDNGTHFTTPGNTASAAPDIKAAIDAADCFAIRARMKHFAACET